MQLNIRRITEEDIPIIYSWWEQWPEWTPVARDFLPDNGLGGLIVEKNGDLIVAGFIYLTNAKVALLEWVVSNPSYRHDDRDQAIDLLITGSENMVKSIGFKYMFSIVQHKKLIEKQVKLGWHKDEKPSYELTKIL